MPPWRSREKESNTCVYCEAEIPKDAEKCPKCGLSNGTKGTTTCDFCGSEIPSNAKICQKCHREQVEAIIRERKAAGTYDADEEPIPPRTTLKGSLKFCLKIGAVALVIALPFGLAGAGDALMFIGIAITCVIIVRFRQSLIVMIRLSLLTFDIGHQLGERYGKFHWVI